MTEEIWELNPDYDQRAARHKAVADLLKLDSEGCRHIKAFADVLNSWDPREPTSDDEVSRAAGHEQITAFRELCEAMLGEWPMAWRSHRWQRLDTNTKPKSKQPKPAPTTLGIGSQSRVHEGGR
jgi:hypothetical protein